MLKAITVFVALSSATAIAAPHEYELDKTHSSLSAKWSSHGITFPTMKFGEFSGDFVLDLEKPENSQIDVIIRTDSLSVGYEGFDNDLRGEWYFNTEEFPEARFIGGEFIRLSETRGVMRGDLTIKNQTHPVVLDVTLNHAGLHPIQPFRDGLEDLFVAGFSAHTTVSRRAFDLGLVRTIPDEIQISIELSLRRTMSPEETAQMHEAVTGAAETDG